MGKFDRKAIYSIFLFTACIIAVSGWIFSRKNLNLSNPSPQIISTSNVNIDDNKTSATDSTSQNLLVLNKSGVSNNVEIFDTLKKASRLAYTDSDENNKIISVIGITNHKIIMAESDQKNNTTNLVSISLDGKVQKDILQKNISVANKPILKPQSNQIMMIDFSPVEKNFGYTLTLEQLDGSNPRVLLHNANSIIAPSFSEDGSQLIFASQVNKGFDIQLYNIQNESIIAKYHLDTVVLDEKWIGNKSIIVSTHDNKNSNSILLVLDSKLNLTKSIQTKSNGNIQNIVSLGDSTIFFIQMNENNSPLEKSTIKSYNLNMQEEINLGNAYELIGIYNG